MKTLLLASIMRAVLYSTKNVVRSLSSSFPASSRGACSPVSWLIATSIQNLASTFQSCRGLLADVRAHAAAQFDQQALPFFASVERQRFKSRLAEKGKDRVVKQIDPGNKTIQKFDRVLAA